MSDRREAAQAAQGRPLRVAYVLRRPPGYSETFIESEIRAVRAAGATVRTFMTQSGTGRVGEAARIGRTLATHPARVFHHVGTLGAGYLPRALLAAGYAVALRDEIAEFAPDVIHAHFVNLPTAIAVLLGRDLDLPITAMAHAADFLLDRDPAALRRRLYQVNELFVISTSTAHQLAELGVDLSLIPHRVVRAAFDGQVWDSVPGSGSGAGVVDRPANRPIRLVTVARLVAKKGIDTSIDAVAELVAGGFRVRYDVYGDGPLRDSLRRRAERHGIAGVVTFHGAMAHAIVTAALAEADVAVLACQRAEDGDLDGIPVFLMEAAGRGVPVVSTRVSGVPELVEEGGGWLVPPADPGALAEAITYIARHPEEARRRSAVLRERVRTEFAPGLQAERLLAAWHRLAGTGHPAAGPDPVNDAKV